MVYLSRSVTGGNWYIYVTFLVHQMMGERRGGVAVFSLYPGQQGAGQSLTPFILLMPFIQHRN